MADLTPQQRLNALRNGQLPVDDEFYTTRRDIREALDHIEAHTRIDAPIICPCDSAASQIVQELTARGYTVEHHEGAFQDCDFTGKFVVTNPPFSLYHAFYRKCQDEAAGFLLVLPVTGLTYTGIYSDQIDGKAHAFTTHGTHWDFDGGDGKSMSCVWLTSLNVPPAYRVTKKQRMKDGELCIETVCGYPIWNFNRLDLPCDAADEDIIAMPVTALAQLPTGTRIIGRGEYNTKAGRKTFKRVLLTRDTTRLRKHMLF